MDSQSWAQILLAVISLLTTLISGVLGQKLLALRRKSQADLEKQRHEAEERLKQKELDLEKARQATAKANADLERSLAESQRIRDQSAAELLKARAEANQMKEILEMSRAAWNRLADVNIAGNEVQALTAAALNKNSETINLLTLSVNSYHEEVKTNLTDITLKMRDLPNDVSVKLNPLQEGVVKLATAINGLVPLIQNLQLAILAPLKEQIQPSATNGAYPDEAPQPS